MILSDMRLGHGVDGLSLGRRLLDLAKPRPALIMVTGETAPERLHALEGSGLPMLFKPVDPELLRHALCEVWGLHKA